MMIGQSSLMLYVPGLPVWSGLVIAFAARNSAIYFTKWYPEYRKAKFVCSAGALPAVRPRAPQAWGRHDNEERIRRLATDFLSTIVFLVIYLAPTR